MALPSRAIAQMVVVESSNASRTDVADLDTSKSIISQAGTPRSRQSVSSQDDVGLPGATKEMSRWRRLKAFVREPTNYKMAACCWQAGKWSDYLLQASLTLIGVFRCRRME